MQRKHGRLRGLLGHAWTWLIKEMEVANKIKIRRAS